MNQPAAHRRATQRGLTLVECATVLSVMATVASMATPAFERSVERRRIEGTAAQIETDVHFARSLAVARNAPVRISFSAQDGASCYVIHTGAAGECGCTPAGQATCSGDAESMRAVRLDAELASTCTPTALRCCSTRSRAPPRRPARSRSPGAAAAPSTRWSTSWGGCAPVRRHRPSRATSRAERRLPAPPHPPRMRGSPTDGRPAATGGRRRRPKPGRERVESS